MEVSNVETCPFTSPVICQNWKDGNCKYIPMDDIIKMEIEKCPFPSKQKLLPVGLYCEKHGIQKNYMVLDTKTKGKNYICNDCIIESMGMMMKPMSIVNIREEENAENNENGE